jgi:hypothetical protein
VCKCVLYYCHRVATQFQLTNTPYLTEGFSLPVFFLILAVVFLTLTQVYPCIFLSCKSNARVKLAKTGHGPHPPTLVCICVVQLLFVLFYVLFVCKCVLLPGDNPTAVNKCIISLRLQRPNACKLSDTTTRTTSVSEKLPHTNGER